MAVVPMQKVQLLVHQSDTDAALATLQQAGAMEFHELESDTVQAEAAPFTYANLLPRVEHAQHFLKTYEAKRGFIKALREGSRVELTEDAVGKVLADTDALEAVVVDI